MQEYTIKDSGMPVRLASALRVPSHAYKEWGIKGNELWLRTESDRAYHTEWEEGTQKQMNYVIEAAKMAGLGNCSNMLREVQASIVFQILNLPKFKNFKRVNYTEPGAGESTVVLYKYLIEKGYDVERIFSTLIEPSKKRVYGDKETEQKGFVEKLEDLGLKNGKHFVPVVGKDSEMPFYLEKNSQHIISDNATRHHHAYLDKVAESDLDLLVPDGFLNRNEWYEGLCEHPARVYTAFMSHDFKPPIKWETKEEDLKRFVEAFPNALKFDYPRFSPEDEMAAEMIKTFWFDGWAVVRGKEIQNGTFDPRDDYYMLEAHGRPGPQIEIVKKAGFRFDTNDIKYLCESAGLNGNPHRILTKEKMIELGMDKIYKNIPNEGSNLLMEFMAQKL